MKMKERESVKRSMRGVEDNRAWLMVLRGVREEEEAAEVKVVR